MLMFYLACFAFFMAGFCFAKIPKKKTKQELDLYEIRFGKFNCYVVARSESNAIENLEGIHSFLDTNKTGRVTGSTLVSFGELRK